MSNDPNVELMRLVQAGHVKISQFVQFKGLPLTMVLPRVTALLSGLADPDTIEGIAKLFAQEASPPTMQFISERTRELLQREERHKFISAMTLLGASQYQLADLFGVRRQTIADGIKRYNSYQTRADWAGRALRAGITKRSFSQTQLSEYYTVWQSFLAEGGTLSNDPIAAAQKLSQLHNASSAEADDADAAPYLAQLPDKLSSLPTDPLE